MTKSKKDKPKVNPKLEGFEIHIDNLGEISSSFEIDRINRFLDKEVEDKKLKDRKDLKKKNEQKEQDSK